MIVTQIQVLALLQWYITTSLIVKKQQMDSERKSVQIYLRIKGPFNPTIKPEFKLLQSNTKIRFKQAEESEEQDIANQFAGVGLYKFEKIFREDVHQEEVYARVAQDLVQSAIEGYNGTIFAYGQTGSGKTYTMTGGDDDPSQVGIIPRVINDLYKEAEAREEEITIKLKYMQIYKKNGYDLLATESKSKKLEDLPQVKAFCKGENFEFENLSEHEAPNFETAMKIYQYGDKNRIVCKTPSNDQSSRSHCIFMIAIRTKNKDTGLQQKATINLVDLAGSERIHYSGMEQKQAKEGISINLGLHYLSRVVLSLGEQSKGRPDIFIPYRDSLLTMALKSSMGGNCKTRMIATIHPNPQFNPENIATCKFSQNLLAMENKLKKNQFINPWDIIKGLKNEVEELKGQITRLKGEDVKQILEREDYLKIHTMVDKFIASTDPATILPINDRLYIREYLNYMRNIIKTKTRGKPAQEQYKQEKNEDYSTAVSQNYIMEVKSLKQQIQQKQNEIQLLLSLINHQKQQNPQNIQDNFIPVQQISENEIAETIANTLMKCKKRRSYNVTAQEVQKNLIKPILLQEEESVEEAFKKFKDAHVKSEDIDEKQHQIELKSMRKQVIEKKIKNLKLQRFKLNERFQELQAENRSNNLPTLASNQSKKQQILDTKTQMQDLDEKIKKKYQELKTMELEINRLGLCKNKNTQKMKYQFEEYMGDRLARRKSEQIDKQDEELGVKDKQNEQDLSSSKVSESNYISTRPFSSQTNKSRKVSDQYSTREQKQQEPAIDQGEVNKQMEQFFEARRKLLSRKG